MQHAAGGKLNECTVCSSLLFLSAPDQALFTNTLVQVDGAVRHAQGQGLMTAR